MEEEKNKKLSTANAVSPDMPTYLKSKFTEQSNLTAKNPYSGGKKV